MRTTMKRRPLILVPLAVAGLLAVSTALATPAPAAAVTHEQLAAQEWTCVEFVAANSVVCFNAGLGRPFPGSPRPSYLALRFDRTTGEFLATVHLIREDLYSGQPCAPGEEPYVFLALTIRYYECVHE
jgi:hypothetical protein